MNSIELSVLVPNYNHGQYLSVCVDLILKYLPESSELIIIDDGSTDNSVALIKEFETRDSRVRFLQNKTNKGVNYTANRGLREAKGRFFSSISVDDIILPGFFSDILKVLKKHPSIALCCSNYAYVNGEEDVKSMKEIALYKSSNAYEVFSPGEFVSISRKTGFWIPGHTTIYRRDKVLFAGGFKKELKLYSDFYLNHRLALEFGVGYIPKALSIMRVHEKSFTAQCLSTKKSKESAICNLLQLISDEGFSKGFRKSNILSPLIKDNLKYFLSNPRYWKYFIPL